MVRASSRIPGAPFERGERPLPRTRKVRARLHHLTIIKRIEPEPSEERKVDLLHKNVQPELKKMTRQAECPNVKAFLYAAVEVELILAEDYKRTPRRATGSLSRNWRQWNSILEELIRRYHQILEKAIRARVSAPKPSKKWTSGVGPRKNSQDRKNSQENGRHTSTLRNQRSEKKPGPFDLYPEQPQN